MSTLNNETTTHWKNHDNIKEKGKHKLKSNLNITGLGV